ncbi:MAG TPA: ATP-dependent helicase [Candidatus Marinimicrobia bacterium]|nr:ATP-dependent helicase [Candidatus Neomarinimicrobiota bacterium]
MKLTEEQQAIIASRADIKINAVAGSGKTSTIIEYAKSRPKGSRILYIAFNKSVRLEAMAKFTRAGLQNVKVETAHSLAFKQIIYKYQYELATQGYKSYEIANILGLKVRGDKLGHFILANHISRFAAYFCNSDRQRVHDLNYLDLIIDPKAQSYVKSNYSYIEKETRIFLAKMDSGEIPVTHDFYLKKFQLSRPILPYDYLLFDEGQDASPAMLDIFLRQMGSKVIVGDTHQQIYSWRFAVNSLEKVDFPTFKLSKSFRFSQQIADLAMAVLKWKNHLEALSPVKMCGSDVSQKINSQALIGRSNLGLLIKAIEYITGNNSPKSIYFEGNIHSYTYAEDGASLYDVLNLEQGRRSLIRDTLIKSMGNMSELEEYIEKTEDNQLGIMVEIVKEYGAEIPEILSQLKEKHVADADKSKAEIIFGTVHRCKGMEYDAVELVPDFLNEEGLLKAIRNKKQKPVSRSKLNEEINLLYVAITRVKTLLQIPESLLPNNLDQSVQISIIKPKEHPKKAQSNVMPPPAKAAFKKSIKSEILENIRKRHAEAYSPWNAALDAELLRLYYKGEKVKKLSQIFERTPGAIRSRIKKLIET